MSVQAAPFGFTVGTQALQIVSPPLDAFGIAAVLVPVSIVKHVDMGAIAVWNHSEREVRVQPFLGLL
jgi:hypothetical protein